MAVAVLAAPYRAHTVPHREDYTQTWSHLHGSGYPLVLMTWGETFGITGR